MPRTTPRAHQRSRIALLVATALLSACGPATPGGQVPQASSTTTVSAGTLQPAPQPTASSSAGSSSSSSSITLTGTIIEGLRPGCHVLQTATARYVLTGPGTPALRTGDRVTVEGRIHQGMVSPCGGRTVVVTRTPRHS